MEYTLELKCARRFLAHGIKTLHLYTLNMDKAALAILMLQNLGIIEETKKSRSLPWRHPTNVFRIREDVQPIFWANRPKSYISSTISWEHFPSGRWADSSNTSYGALSDYHVNKKFMKYCLGKLRSSPWSELDEFQPETKIINEQLGNINLKGFLTINSQPAVNGEKSDSPPVGDGEGQGKIFMLEISEHCYLRTWQCLISPQRTIYQELNKIGVAPFVLLSSPEHPPKFAGDLQRNTKKWLRS